MKLLINIPGPMLSALKWLLVDHFDGIEPRQVWSQLVSEHRGTILTPGFQSTTSKIRDPEFYKENSQEDFTINDEHEGFFKTAKGLRITRAAKRAEKKDQEQDKFTIVRNNNGAVMREVLFLELIDCKYMHVDGDGKVKIERPAKKSERKKKGETQTQEEND